MEEKENKFLKYFLVSLIIAIAGFPFFIGDQEYIIFGFIISLIAFRRARLKFDKLSLLLILIFFIVEVLQSFKVGEFEVKTITGTYIRLFFAYFVVKIVKKDFLLYYVKILYVLCIISFFFYLFSFLPGFINFFLTYITPLFKSPFHQTGGFYTTSENVIIFTFEASLWEASRNPGPFWEPGAFATFTCIALLFNLVINQKINNKYSYIFILAIITTFSTSGYIALFLTLFLFVNSVYKSKIKYLFVIIIAITCVILYQQLDFLGKKVAADEDKAFFTTGSRFGSALLDLNDFSNSPFVGWGRGSYRYGGDKVIEFTQIHHRNNGLTDLLATYGSILFIVYFIAYYYSFRKLNEFYKFNKSFAISMLIVFLVLGFSQGLFMKPFFYALLFLHSIYQEEKPAELTAEIVAE
jgi:hypothetical protein